MRRGGALAAGCLLALLGQLPTVGAARPLVEPGARPGAVAAWSEADGAVRLEVASGVDAAAVAAAVARAVSGAKAEARDGKVLVRGVTLAALLPALEKVELEAGGADDIDAMLSSIRGDNTDEGSGSSIRATAETNFSDVFADESSALTARVLAVKRQQFPLVVVTLQLTRGIKDDKVLRKGAKLEVIPRVRSRAGVVDVDDKLSKLNVGAWYAQPGDLVRVKLETEPREGVWVATAFERQKPR